MEATTIQSTLNLSDVSETSGSSLDVLATSLSSWTDVAASTEMTEDHTNVTFPPEITISTGTGVFLSENVSDLINTTLGVGDGHEVPYWSRVFDDAQLGLTVIGVIANLVTFVALFKGDKAFNATILLLLKHQSMIDALCCLSAALLLIFPPMWTTGHPTFDTIVCHVWHGQGLYWQLIFLSAYTLTVIAVERFFAVCRPFQHQELTPRRVGYVLVGLYVASCVCTSGAYLHVRYDGHQCLSESVFKWPVKKYYHLVFSISTWFTFWTIPTAMFVGLYGNVVHAFRQRSQQNLGTSRVIDQATTQLTKTAIVVTIIFIVSLGYDVNYYLLGNLEVVEFVVNSPLQKVGILFSVFNSTANPFIYALLMPAYRKMIIMTVCCQLSKPHEASANSGSSQI